MKRLLIVAILLSATLMAAQPPRKLYGFRDKKGDFAIEAMTSYVSEYSDENGTIDFKGAGNPIKGWSKKQGITFETASIAGTALKSAQDEIFLQKANLSGNVTISMTRDLYGQDTNKNSVKIGVADTVMTTANLDFLEDNSNPKVTIPGNFKVVETQTLPQGDQKNVLTVTGRRAEFTFLPFKNKSKDPLLGATANGPVVLDYVGAGDVEVEKKDGDKVIKTTERRTTKVHATGEKMVYDAKDRTLTLSGNIVYEYTAPAGYVAEGNCDSLVVTFDEKNKLKTVTGKAEDGKTVVKEGGKGK